MTGGPIIAPIVEGRGEVAAARELIRRVAGELCGVWDVDVAQPFRVDSGKMLKTDELSRAVRVQAARIRGRGGILILRDGDDVDCPVTLAQHFHPESGLVHVPVHVVVAYPEYEAWLLAALESLVGHPDVRPDAIAPSDPEAKRDAKGVLAANMGCSYRETRHQAAFTARIDLPTARSRSRSFRRLVHVVELLVAGP